MSKDFDELLSGILDDYQNQFPDVDRSQGSLVFIKSAVSAAALWGLYKHQEHIADQMFPDTADTENLEHHAYIQNITRKNGESDTDYLDRLLNAIRKPPAGGNDNDYIQWAKTITNIVEAYVIPLAQGLGTVDVVVLADEDITGSEVPSDHTTQSGTNDSVVTGKLADSTADFLDAAKIVRVGDIAKNDTDGSEAIVTAVDSLSQLSLSADIFSAVGKNYTIDSITTQVYDYIDTVRPVTSKYFRVLAPTVDTQAVTMTLEGDDANISQTVADITAHMNGLEPGQTLFVNQLISIAIENGADNATVTAPAADVTATASEMIRPGVIDVS